MAGELVPLVLLPRYTTYAGDTPFSTIGMDVTQYQSAIVNAWRGVIVGDNEAFAALFQESTDQVVWTTCTGVSGAVDPGEDTETQYVLTLKKRWFRVVVTLGDPTNVASCWAVGFLEERLR